MTLRRATALVARREITERSRDRSLLISTFVTLAVLCVVVAIAASGGEDRYAVAAAGPQATEIAQGAAERARGVATVDVRAVEGDGAARALVASGEADAALVDDGRRILVEEELDGALGGLLQAAAARAPEPLPVATLTPAEEDDGKEGLAFLVVFLLYGQLIGYGFWVAAGVVEEKSSRVVEILLSAIPPRALLAGKVIGIGIVGLAQLLVVSIAGVALAGALGALDQATGGLTFGDVAGAVAIALAFFLVGWAFFASAFAMAGAVVGRQEDLQSSSAPMTLVLVASLFGAIYVINEPGTTLAAVLSLVPPVAPIAMPVQVIVGDAAAWEVAVAVATTLAASAGLVAVAARVYENAILRTSGRVSWRAAWRGG